MSERIAIGVDAGGTSTVAALSRDGIFESEAREGPANASSRGIEAAALTIATAVRELTGDTDPGVLFVAAAGAGRTVAREGLAMALRAAFPQTGAISVEEDLRVALRAAIPEGPGIVLIGGTGSVAYAEHGERHVRVGGDGYLLGDEGSAYAIGLAALKLLARTYDERVRPDETTDLAARHFDIVDRDGMLEAIYGAPLNVARVAALAPAIVAFAGKGNRTSTKIVQTAAQDLGDLVRTAVRATGLGELSPSIALAGGLFRENSMLTYLLEHRLVNETPGAAIVRSRDEPVRAALRFAEALEA